MCRPFRWPFVSYGKFDLYWLIWKQPLKEIFLWIFTREDHNFGPHPQWIVRKKSITTKCVRRKREREWEIRVGVRKDEERLQKRSEPNPIIPMSHWTLTLTPSDFLLSKLLHAEREKRETGQTVRRRTSTEPAQIDPETKEGEPGSEGPCLFCGVTRVSQIPCGQVALCLVLYSTNQHRHHRDRKLFLQCRDRKSVV